MPNNRGKAFEKQFKENWLKCFPNTFLHRLPDQMNGYLTTSQNPCDFISFISPDLYLIECKSHEGSSIDFSAIPQYERLLRYKNYSHVFSGILVWFRDKDCILWFPIETAEVIFNRGEKSLGLRHLKDTSLKVFNIPAVKKRVFLECDFKELIKYVTTN